MRKPFLLFVLLLIFAFILSACGSSANGAAQAIEAYIRGLANKDSVQVSNLSCADWEPSAMVEIDSFTGVGAKVEDLTCEQSGQDGADIYVSCTGSLALDYNGEAQQIDLSTRTYLARQEGGEWRMCGYR